MRSVCLSILVSFLILTSVYADIPNTLNYQGRLMDQAGQPVLDGQYTVTFRLYTAASGGNMVWEEQQTVATQNGYFNTVLGNTTALTPSMFSQPLWVGMQVGGNAEMTPRQKLSTAAYAMTVADGGISLGKINTDLWLKILPIGTILAWHPNITNPPLSLPDGFVECNGQTITGTGGCLDGAVVPDLNSQGRFLRGSSSSGTMQEEEMKSHTHSLNNAENCIGTGGTTDANEMGGNSWGSYLTSTGSAGGSETRPINMSVVWIMKIK